MVLRSIIFFLLLIVIPDLWIDYHFLRLRNNLPVWKRLLWWVPCAGMLAYTCWMAAQESFIPADRTWLDVYLWLIGLIVIPKAVFSLCSLVGYICKRQRGARSIITTALGSVLAVISFFTYIYGNVAGFRKLEVRHVDLWYNNLPSNFDGYRIVLVSDLHVGTYTNGQRQILEQVVDSILSQKADIVCHTGDLQNVYPDEVAAVSDILRRMKNVYSVLGNHDYADYATFKNDRRGVRTRRDQLLRDSLVNKMKEVQRDMLGFTLLDNESRRITRDSSSIYIVGEGNYSKPPKKAGRPSIDYSDHEKAMRGVPKDAFVIMLQHNPQAWQDILLASHTSPHSSNIIPDLTLSGHTHGGQIAIGPLRPTLLVYQEDRGLYRDGDKYIYVTSGVGGVVAMRLCVSPEIVVITLRKK